MQRPTDVPQRDKPQPVARDFDAAIVGGPPGSSALAWVAKKAAEAQSRMDALAAAGQPFVPKYRKIANPAEDRQRALDAAMPGEWQGMTLGTFNGYTSELRLTATKVAEFINEPRGFLYLYGDVGTGKTHLAAGAAIRLVERGFPVRVYRAADVASRFRSASQEGAGELERYVNRLKSTRVLVLDDFGAEHLTEFVAAEWYDVLDCRHGTLMPTIITANVHPDSLNMPRLASRLLDVRWSTVAGITAKDYRAMAAPPRMGVSADDYAPPSIAEPACPTCGGFGIVKRDLPTGHMHFGRAFPCPTCKSGGEPLKNGGDR